MSDVKTVRIHRWLPVLGAGLLAAACGSGGLGSGGDGPAAPTNVQIADGDQHVKLTWDGPSDVNWWVYCATDPGITIDNWSTLRNPVSRINVTSPYLVQKLINGQQYSCIVNGRHGSDKGGEPSPALTATTRPGGATWVAETAWTPANLNGVASGNDHLVAVGDAGAIWYLKANQGWTQVTTALTTSNLNAIVFSNGRFIAVGDNGAGVTSTDGENWSSLGMATTANLRGITELGVNYVAVGDGGVIVTSADATTWAQRTSPTTATLFAAAANNDAGGIVISGAAGTLLYSTDTVNWQVVTSPSTLDLRGVAYGNGVYTAVGAQGVQLASTDGRNWVQRPGLTTATLNSVVYDANIVNSVTYSVRYVAVGADGAALYSGDGQNWTLTNSATTAELRAVGFGLGRYLAVGTAGVTSSSY